MKRELGWNQHGTKRPVRYCHCGDHAWLTLTRGSVTLVDPEDGERLGAWSWSTLTNVGGRRCAVRRQNKGSYIYMHREIMDPPDDMVVDHISGDALDNRKRNLRNCEERHNLRNVRPQRRNTSSQFKGVYYDKSRNNYQAYVSLDGKRHTLGRFKNEKDAARAYDKKAMELHGKFACTNQSLGLLS